MISHYLLTDPGKRGNNEDNIGMYQAGNDYCFVLCDGLGGPKAALRRIVLSYDVVNVSGQPMRKPFFWVLPR